MTVELIRQYKPCLPIGPSFARLVPRVALTFLHWVASLLRSLASPGLLLLRSQSGGPASVGTEMQKSSTAENLDITAGAHVPRFEAPSSSHWGLGSCQGGALPSLMAERGSQGPFSWWPSPCPSIPSRCSPGSQGTLICILMKVWDGCFCRQPTATAGSRLKNTPPNL